MWTKCLTPEGRPFYYNAVQNESLWQPPAEAVIHEAANLKIPEITPSGDNIESSDQFLAEVLALNEAVQSTKTNEIPYSVANSSSMSTITPVDPEVVKNDAMFVFSISYKLATLISLLSILKGF